MNAGVCPILIESEPFEVAMGGYLVTVFSLINSKNKQNLAPHLKFKEFLETSPQKDFSILISWNSVCDESDLTMQVLNNLSGEIHSLGPVHSIPTQVQWKADSIVSFVVKVRPAVSKLEVSSEFDLAKMTLVTIEKVQDHFKINYLSYL